MLDLIIVIDIGNSGAKLGAVKGDDVAGPVAGSTSSTVALMGPLDRQADRSFQHRTSARPRRASGGLR